MILNALKRVCGVAAALFVMVSLFGADTAHAQTLKVGYTDHEVIIVNMNEYRTVQQQLQREVQGGQQELQTLYADLQEKADRYQKQQALLSAEKRQEREQELAQLQQQIQQQAAQKDQELAQRQGELMQPLLDRVQTAIDKVAKAKNLDLVLRSQVGSEPVLLYVNENTIVNITMDVARELGIDVGDEPTASGAN